MTETKKLRVFLCHANVDKSRAKKLYKYLLDHGIQPWIDAEDILPGKDWQEEITNAMDASDAILAILSQDSVKKEGYVQRELKYALKKAEEKPSGTIFLIPLKLEECEARDLNHIQWVNWFEKKGPLRLIIALKQRAEQLGCSQVKLPQETESSPDLSKKKNTAPESWKEINDRLTVENDILKEQVRDQSHRYQLQVNLLSKERDSLKEQVFDYKLQIQLLTERMSDLKEQVSDHKTQITSLTKERDSLNERISEFKIQIQLLTKETSNLKEQISGYKAQIASLTKERDGLNEQISDFKIQIQSLTKETSNLKEQISGYKAQIASLTRDGEDLKEQISDYRSQIETLTKERNDLKELVSDLRVEINQLTLHNKTLNDEIEDLKNGQKFNGLSFNDLRDLLDEKAQIPPDETVDSIKKKYADAKNKGDISYRAIEHYLTEQKLIDFYWVFSRLIEYGLSKADAESIPAIHSNLKRLMDFGLVQREKKDTQTFFVHTESGKSFLLRLMADKKDPFVKETLILG